MCYSTKTWFSRGMKHLLICALLATQSYAGTASWYGIHHQGKLTASGQPFDRNKLTAASWYYRLGTKVRVTNTKTGKSVVVTINDRGPAKHLGREIDLSQAAFSSIADTRSGLAQVSIKVLN